MSDTANSELEELTTLLNANGLTKDTIGYQYAMGLINQHVAKEVKAAREEARKELFFEMKDKVTKALIDSQAELQKGNN